MFKDIYTKLNQLKLNEIDSMHLLVLKGLHNKPNSIKGHINKIKILTKWRTITKR